MITTTHSPTRKCARNGGFTLTEVMVAAGISAFLLAGVMSSFLFLGRSGANIQNYNDMEAEARRALEFFAEDTRQASAITWNSSTSVTLTVNSTPITYAYDSGAQTFTRQVASGTTRALVTKIVNFTFSAFPISEPLPGQPGNLPLGSASELLAASKATKLLQVSLETARTTRTVARASNTVLSARFILRNKRITT